MKRPGIQLRTNPSNRKSDYAAFAAFIIAGGVSAVFNIGSRIVLNIWIPYIPAIIVAYVIGMLIAFVLNRAFVFREAANPLHHQVLWFTAVNVAGVVQTLIVSLVLARWLFPILGWNWHTDTLAHALGVAAPAFTSFIGHKHLSFRNT